MHKRQKIKNCFLKATSCIILLFLMLVGCGLSVYAEENTNIINFGITAETPDKEYEYAVNWWQSEKAEDNQYYITLPYAVQGQSVTLNCTGQGSIYYDGAPVYSGMRIQAFAEGQHIISCMDQEYTLQVMYTSDIPALFIQTESGSMEEIYAEKEHKEPGYAVILRDNRILYEDKLEYIKGRGNATWDYEKKPFNIKFEKKINLFEMGKAKKWTLLANYLDDTLLKNKLACDLADAVGLPFSSKSILLDLYIDGEYYGNYTLIESIEIGENRVDITDLEKANEQANPKVEMKHLDLKGTRGLYSYLETGSYKWAELPTSPGVINGGYLLEFELADRYDDEACGFISNYGQPVILKSPEYASKEQVAYISDYYQDFEDAVLSKDGYNTKGKHYSEYVDMETMAKMYVFQEYVKNLDAGLTSFYIYKDVNEKMMIGPVWDFDSSLGRYKERNGVQMADPKGIWVAESYLLGELSDKKTILSLMCAHEDFRRLAKQQWEDAFEPNMNAFFSQIEQLHTENRQSIVADKCKWKNRGNYELTYEWVDDCVDTLSEFASERSEFMRELFSKDYHSNAQNTYIRETGFLEQIKEFFKKLFGW